MSRSRRWNDTHERMARGQVAATRARAPPRVSSARRRGGHGQRPPLVDDQDRRRRGAARAADACARPCGAVRIQSIASGRTSRPGSCNITAHRHRAFSMLRGFFARESGWGRSGESSASATVSCDMVLTSGIPQSEPIVDCWRTHRAVRSTRARGQRRPRVAPDDILPRARGSSLRARVLILPTDGSLAPAGWVRRPRREQLKVSWARGGSTGGSREPSALRGRRHAGRRYVRGLDEAARTGGADILRHEVVAAERRVEQPRGLLVGARELLTAREAARPLFPLFRCFANASGSRSGSAARRAAPISQLQRAARARPGALTCSSPQAVIRRHSAILMLDRHPRARVSASRGYAKARERGNQLGTGVNGRCARRAT